MGKNCSESRRIMASEMRNTVVKAMEHYRRLLKPDNKQWKVLEVGIDGDPKPGGNYKLFGIGNDYKTLDILERVSPDIVADICDTKLPKEEWDLIILSQTLEHIFDFRSAIKECHRLLKKGGFLIIDCPFFYPYHGVDGYGDYWRISHTAMQKLVEEVGFKIGKSVSFNKILTSAMVRKSK